MNNKKEKTGFSLVEVTVALGIVMIGLMGVVSLVIQNLQVQNVNRNYLLASILSQEGIELVRNIRDENWLYGSYGWDDDIAPAATYTLERAASYTINYNNTRATIDHSVAGINDARLYINSDGYYDHNVSASSTVFYRLISSLRMPKCIGGLNDGESCGDGSSCDTGTCEPAVLLASSTVMWVDRGKTYNYVTEAEFSNWRE